MENTIKVGICLMTALTLIGTYLVGCSEQTHSALGTTRGSTSVTTGTSTASTTPGNSSVTIPKTTGPNDVDITEPSQMTTPTHPVETMVPNETTGPTETTTPVETTPTVETTIPTTEPTEITTPPATTEPPAPSTPAITETTTPETAAPHVHSYTESTIAATCTEPGYTQYTCACGDSYEGNYTDIVKHNYNRTITTPTCTEQGYTTYTCSVCEETYKDDYTDPAHSWGEWEQPPVQDSTIQWTCTVCGEVKKEFIHQEKYDVELWEPATADEAAVAQAILKYVNQFRAEEGSTQLTYLPGLSQVSQYRSRQIVTNFAHDTHDMREAAEYYQYGEYVDWAEHGCPELVEQNYWNDCAREAIGALLGNRNGYSFDKVGYTLANAMRESIGHWRYVGSSDYSYVGIGVAYSDGEWFACIQVSVENHDKSDAQN